MPPNSLDSRLRTRSERGGGLGLPSAFQILLAAVISGGLASAQEVADSVDGPLQSFPLEQSASGKAEGGFVKMAPEASGIDFTNLLKPENIKKYLYNGAGGCAGDYDGDGLTDLFLVSEDGPNRLYRQEAPWRFVDMTEEAGGLSGGEAWGSGASFVDIDGDGDLDLYVCNMGSRNLLYLNQGDGTFREGASEFGLDYEGASVMASFCDYDRDGDLDCYLLTYRLRQLADEFPDVKVRKVDGEFTVHPDHVGEYHFINGQINELGRADVLFRNDGAGHFTDVSGYAGLGGDPNHGLSAVWWDYNNDHWPDLYVASDFKDPDRLWRNNGDGTFTDVLPEMVTYTAWFAMGSDFGDINRDGWFDYYVADMSATNHYRQKMEMGSMGRNLAFLQTAEPRQFMRNSLFVNQAGRRFLESGFLSGLESTGWTWAVRFADLDCDGWEDAIVTNGMIRDVNNADFTLELDALRKAGREDEIEEKIMNFNKSGAAPNMVFRNRGDLTFEDVSQAWGYDINSASYGLILADFDRDGDLDVVVNNMNQPVGVFRNEAKEGNRVLVELRGRSSNAFGVGARVRLKSASGWQTRMLSLARGYQSASEPVLHFGLGGDDSVEQLEITWPSGIRQTLSGLASNHRYRIVETGEQDDSSTPLTGEPAESKGRLFALDAVPGFEFEHKENAFDDYVDQPLLPWKLSRLGPGIAVGDADGDGDEDVWVGGAGGQDGRMIIRNPGGRWISTMWGPWTQDADSEDMGAVFFDPDADGDLDLYVASGGARKGTVERTRLEDRLYLNVGEQGYGKAEPSADPKERAFLSAGVTAAADFDQDGDVDVFVGSRLTPGQFHEIPDQRLLRNEGDRMKDVVDEVAPGLKEIGQVAGALWSDYNNDGRLDLLVTVPWGPIRVFRQEEDGTLSDATEEAGLSRAFGWWQGIDGGDLDGDGDVDYIVTNLGRNTKYHASEAKPFKIYAEDFDGDGKCDLVEAEYEGNTLYPMRGRSCSSEAMPFIRNRFKTFHEFAVADLAKIYTAPKLDTAQVFRLTHLDSVVLINDGEGHFEMRSLPTLAQIAPGFGVVVEDFDGDGNEDAVIAQNFYSPQPETGRMSGGLGVFLKGKGDGGFTEWGAEQSGIWIPGDAKSLALADLNDDGAPDLVCGVNNGPVRTLLNQTRGPEVRWSCVTLDGAKGNPTAIGSRLTIETSDGENRMREVAAGGSYLSQSTPRQFIALSKGNYVKKVTVRWPGGEVTEAEFPAFQNHLSVTHP